MPSSIKALNVSLATFLVALAALLQMGCLSAPGSQEARQQLLR
jgi:hypothetical protein